MKFLSTTLKKTAGTCLLTVCFFSLIVSPAAAAVNARMLSNTIGNELQAEFHVTEADADDTVVLSWDIDGQNLELESYDLLKDEEKSVTYYVSPGAENDDDLTVSILLKLPDASAAAVQSVKVDGDAVSSAFSEIGYTYYLINEALQVTAGASVYTESFNIAFNQTTASGMPFTASLIAVKEEGKKAAPQLETMQFDFADGQYELIIGGDGITIDWVNNRTAVHYSLDGGVTYSPFTDGNFILDEQVAFTVVYISEEDLATAGYIMHIKVLATGYEDAELEFSVPQEG